MVDEKGSSLGSGDGAGRSPEGLAFPVEFELRVIYELAKADGLAEALGRTLAERGASRGLPKALPAKQAAENPKYGRMACQVRFADKDAMYAAYAAVGALPGVKAVL